MYNTSQKWKDNIYNNIQSIFNLYVDEVLINPDYIFDFRKGGQVIEEEFMLGSTPSQYVEIKIHKEQLPSNPKTIRIEYGILDNPECFNVAKVNTMSVGSLNETEVQNLAGKFEIIPIGIYNIDDYIDNDDNTVTIKALDNMIKFEFNYDNSELVENRGTLTLLEIVQDICNKAGVELGSTSFLNDDITTELYDNSITAREHLSYIAESAGCFACIGRDGKLYFRNIFEAEAEVDIELFETYKWGEEYQISKVSFDDNTNQYSFGNNTRNNLWINQENMYISDEEQVENIYNEINGLTTNSFEGKTIIEPALDIGDKIIIDGKPVIYQGEMSLEGRFIAEISSKIQIKQKEETTAKEESQKVVNRIIKNEIKDINENKLPSVYEQAVETATELLTQFNGGYVIKKDGELYIADNQDLDRAQHIWRWNINGLGYSSTGINGPYELAMTMNGQIVADFITTGKLSADRIFGGTLTVGGINNGNGVINVSDNQGNTAIAITKDGIVGTNFSIGSDGTVSFANATMDNINILSGSIELKDKSISQDAANLTIRSINNTYKGYYRSNGFSIYGDDGTIVIDTGAIFPGAVMRIINNSDASNKTVISNGTITAVNISQTSLKEHKKNFKLLENAIDIIKTIDIYKYNMKFETDSSKKHIGFVIGDNFKYSEEVTSKDNDSVDLYSFVSLCCQAIKEQQEIIEQIQKGA